MFNFSKLKTICCSSKFGNIFLSRFNVPIICTLCGKIQNVKDIIRAKKNGNL